MAQKVSPDQVQALSDNMRQMSELIGDRIKRLSKDLINLNDEVSRSYSEPYVQSASNKLSSLLGEMTSFTTLITGHIDAQAKGLKNAADSYRQTEQASKTTLKQPASAPILNGQLSYNPKTVNSSVQKLQQRLKALGYDIEDDGKFGKQTLAAVNAYKNKYGLGNTGKDEGHVGKQTWLYLFGQLNGELRYDPKTYSDQVRMAQIRLKDLGYNVDVTGYFDSKTLTAVNKFKEDKKLGNTGKFEGVIGPQTWEVLFSGAAGTINLNPKPSNNSSQSNVILSEKSIEMIVAFEVTSKKAYEKLYIHPELPGASSGITIGIGYDIGQVSYETFKKDWEGRLSKAEFELLSKCVGKHLSQNETNNKEVRDLLKKVSHVTIPWETANEVFRNVSLPSFIERTRKTFPHFDLLPEEARGVLVSLVYNRGGSLNKNQDSRKEMVAISEYMKSKTSFNQADLTFIANEIRDMKRLWPGKSGTGLRNRRDLEAEIMETAKINPVPQVQPPSSQGKVPTDIHNKFGTALVKIDVFADQFMPRNNNTYCNIYVQAVMKEADIPFPKGTANQIVTSLRNKEKGWTPITLAEAYNLANQGYPVVTGWKNESGHGHVNIVVPNSKPFDKNDPYHSILVNNVGSSNFVKGSLTSAYGPKKLPDVEFYVYKKV